MELKKLSVVDAVSFGFHAVLYHVRLFFLVLLEAVGLIGAVVILVSFFNQELAMSIVTAVKDAAYYQGSIAALNIVTGNSLVTFISALILAIAIVGFDFGFKKVALQVHDQGDSNPAVVFSCFNLAPQAILAWIAYGIACGVFLFGPIFVAIFSLRVYGALLSFSFYSVIYALCSLLMFIPGVVIMLRCMIFPYFIIDKNAGPIAALRMSWHATEGHFWDLLAFWLVIKTIVYFGYLTMFGWVLIWPLSTLAYVFVYRHFVHKSL